MTYTDHEPVVDEDDRRCTVVGCSLLREEHELDPLWGLSAQENRLLREALRTRVDKLDQVRREDLPDAARLMVLEDREQLNQIWGRLERSPVGRVTSAPLVQRERY